MNAELFVEVTDLFAMLRAGNAEEKFSARAGRPLVVTALDSLEGCTDMEFLASRLGALPCVHVATLERPPGDARKRLALAFDLLLVNKDVSHAMPEAIVMTSGLDHVLTPLARTVHAYPLASTSLALLLRSQKSRNVDHGLSAESAVYSMLQAGPEFAKWMSTRKIRKARKVLGPAVLTTREDHLLRITLNHPEVHNAISLQMRDELTSILTSVMNDPTISSVILEGKGPSFCSGGLLDEFGTFPDPASAHIVRLTRSVARVISRVGHLTEARIHGSAIGAGVELAAFAGHVIADPSTRIALPEISFGLIPGAGGTVSLVRRIGRQRLIYLALSGLAIGPDAAHEWGLVDEIRARQEW